MCDIEAALLQQGGLEIGGEWRDLVVAERGAGTGGGEKDPGGDSGDEKT